MERRKIPIDHISENSTLTIHPNKRSQNTNLNANKLLLNRSKKQNNPIQIKSPTKIKSMMITTMTNTMMSIGKKKSHMNSIRTSQRRRVRRTSKTNQNRSKTNQNKSKTNQSRNNNETRISHKRSKKRSRIISETLKIHENSKISNMI
jgi:hypothetical protein